MDDRERGELLSLLHTVWTVRAFEEKVSGPILRVGAPSAPVPASPVLEKQFVPRTAELLGAVRDALVLPRT